jgi:tetratricopeptide (TPR) repeat protein
VLSIYRQSDHNEAGIAFLEKHYPELARGEGHLLDHEDVTGNIASMYDDGGRPERAFSLYRDAISQQLVLDPEGETLSYHSNNLAYIYSTNDAHIDEGLRLIRRTLATQGGRKSIYIDTLGWLLYRRGDLEAAETEIRRAIRSSEPKGEEVPTFYDELYAHMSTILGRLGYHSRAAWFAAFSPDDA